MNYQIIRADKRHRDVVQLLLEEYFAALQVVVRDDEASMDRLLMDNTGNALWLAYVDGKPAGCIVLRSLSVSPRAGEIKRLWVRPAFRRNGLGPLLMRAAEEHARNLGFTDLYLDTKEDLVDAIRLYERFGYQRFDRYNDNPQAAYFFRKSFVSQPLVREFRSGDEEAFWKLNEAWISKLFKLEPKDLEVLKNPRKYVLDPGGKIYMAVRGTDAVGCCALLNMHGGSYEVAKMGVAESERGKGVGRALLQYAVSDARDMGIRRLYIETNSVLKNAIHLYESVGFRHILPAAPSPYQRADVFMEMLLS